MPKIRDKAKYQDNLNIKKVTDSNIQFTQEFKIKAIKAFKKGSSAEDIFEEAGISIEDFVRGYARKSICRWIEASTKYGAENLNEERRGKGSTGRPRGKFKSLAEEVEYLRAEVEFLKELRALGISEGKKRNTK